MSQMIKTRRYVSAPAGSYPAPVPEESSLAVAPAPTASGTANDLEQAMLDRAPLVSAPASPPFTDAAPVAVEADFSEPVAVPETEETPVQKPETPERTPVRAFSVIMGMLGGAILGVFTGLLLLVYSFPDQALSRLGDPVDLWLSVDDPLVKTSAVLVAAGFLLLGLGVGSWTRRKR